MSSSEWETSSGSPSDPEPEEGATLSLRRGPRTKLATDLLGLRLCWLLVASGIFMLDSALWLFGIFLSDASTEDESALAHRNMFEIMSNHMLVMASILLNLMNCVGVLLAYRTLHSDAFHEMVDEVAINSTVGNGPPSRRWPESSRFVRGCLAKLTVFFILCHAINCGLNVLSIFTGITPLPKMRLTFIFGLSKAIEENPVWAAVAVPHIVGFIGWMVPLMCPLFLMLELVRARIEVVLCRLEQEDSETIDWVVMMRSLRRMDDEMGAFWTLGSAGGPWCFFFAGQMVYIILCFAIALNLHPTHPVDGAGAMMRITPPVLAMAEALTLVSGLGLLAHLTSKCSSHRTASRSIVNMIHRFAAGPHRSKQAALEYDRCVAYIGRKRHGVELGGAMLVDWSIVMRIATMVLFQVPVAYAVVQIMFAQNIINTDLIEPRHFR